MPTLSFSYDTGNISIARIVNGIAEKYGYNANIPDPNNPNVTIPNPQTKAEFARAVVKRILIDAVREADLRTARANLEASVTNIDLT